MGLTIRDRRRLIRDFFAVFSICGGTQSIRVDQVAHLFSCPTREVRRQVNEHKKSSSLKIEVYKKNIYIFGTSVDAENISRYKVLAELIRNFLERSFASLKKRTGEYLSPVISKIIPLIVKLNIDLSLTQYQIELLIRCSEWNASHAFSLLLVTRTEKRFPSVCIPALALLRVKSHDHQNHMLPHLRTISEIEMSHAGLILEVLKRAKSKPFPNVSPVTIHIVVLLHFFKIVLFLFLSPLFPKRGEMYQNLMEDTRHWRTSEEVLAAYWTDPRLSRNSGLELVFSSLQSMNILKSVRALDWYLFCEAHCRWSFRIGLVYSVLRLLTKKITPVQNAELLMHHAILCFYQGSLKSSFSMSSEVELLLHSGHNLFNRHTNLATALRTAVALKMSVLSAGLFHKARLIPEFNFGFLSKRIIICGIIQWLREDSSDNYDPLIANLNHESSNFPPLPRGTIELMICIALIEKHDFLQAKVHLEKGVNDLKNGHLLYPYQKIINALNRKILAGLCADSQYLLRGCWKVKFFESNWIRAFKSSYVINLGDSYRTKIGLQFGELGICPGFLYSTFDLSGKILSATNEKELIAITKTLIESWLPEFRFQGKCLNEELTSFPPPPCFAEKGESHLIIGNITVTEERFVTKKGAIWTSIGASSLLPNIGFKFSICAPNAECDEQISRFELAKQICIWFSQVASNLEYQSAILTNARSSAIARTTQSLAHDVRRPFTMFKMIIEAVENEPDPLESKQLLKDSLPEVQQAMASVDGMIADVLEIGSESAPVLEPANPETLIEATLNEIFRVYPDSKINITYQLFHKYKVDVDTVKIGRVFSNIVGNAIQAMCLQGMLWFETEEFFFDGKPFIRFCVGNGGSYIPSESLPKLFDAFFTSGKKGGTGLGLAIAQKIVAAHGGMIWCKSDAQRGVEFFFTLPRTDELIDQRSTPLPPSSADITTSFERLRKTAYTGTNLNPDPFEVTLEKEIIRHAIAIAAPIDVLVVDDEGVYRNSLAALINRSDDLKKHVVLSFAKNSDEALSAMLLKRALVVQDVDLGARSLSGYEVLKILRTQGYQGVVCIHSNRTSQTDYKMALEAGADAVLPKPMGRTHFLKLILQAAERFNLRALPAISQPNIPEFALLDDSKLTLRAWQRKIGTDAIMHAFTSPSEFLAHVEATDGFLERLLFLVTDFYFADGILDNGLSFAESLRPHFHKPIILCSGRDFNLENIKGYVDAVISKEPVDWKDLLLKIKDAPCSAFNYPQLVSHGETQIRYP